MTFQDNKLVIAIDGPAGAGKSSVARQVSIEMGYIYIDTGAMYRALTVKALRLGVDFEDTEALTKLARETDIKITYRDHTQIIFMDGEDVSEEIRLPRVSQNVSLTAKVPGVRVEMVRLQQELGKDGGVVMDGRDIGTYVFPEANCKIFLTASAEERARRRAKDLEAAGIEVDLKQLENEIIRRDEIDSTREMAPLAKAEDAVLLDTSDMTFDQVVKKVRELVLGDLEVME
jgi:cytidylate kinase